MRETIGEALRRGRGYLDRRGVADPQRTAELLLGSVVGADLGALRLQSRDILPDDRRRAYGKLLCRRGRRVPTQYLLGSWEFFGHDLYVGAGSLIPRPDTETLVEHTLLRLSNSASLVVDVGTGSGCIAIALALARPSLSVIATDISNEALAIARRNVVFHELEARVTLVRGDLLEPVADSVLYPSIDAIVSNPPYIPTDEIATLEPEVREHEPRCALDGGPDGLSTFRRLVAAASSCLRAGGLLLVEVGYGQVEQVAALMTDANAFHDIQMVTDVGGVRRVVSGVRVLAGG